MISSVLIASVLALSCPSYARPLQTLDMRFPICVLGAWFTGQRGLSLGPNKGSLLIMSFWYYMRPNRGEIVVKLDMRALFLHCMLLFPPPISHIFIQDLE